jgi:hypothetical protein
MALKKILNNLILLLMVVNFNSCNDRNTENRMISHEFSHQVYFWLNNPGDQADREAFENAIDDLLRIPEIKAFHIGIPSEATADRGVVDASYTYSLLVFFDDENGHDIYQDHPIHLKFVEDNHHLWHRVVVYDSVTY